MEYLLARRLSGEEYQHLMDRGYRKFGRMLFRPRCPHCAACRPIRVPVASFRPSRSQRRALRLAGTLRVHLGPARGDAEHIDLYNRYHAAQAHRKGWAPQAIDAGEYHASFLDSPIAGGELSIRDADGDLLAVLLLDLTPAALSAVYHYYDPAAPKLSLGTLLILHAIHAARELDKPWLYLGYYVAGCANMTYKANYRPCELLGPDGVWRAET